MGILKFPFPNPQDIYLHDTPDHEKFNLANRNLSNGCVRVEDAKRLGTWLLGQDAGLAGKHAGASSAIAEADADLSDLHHGAGPRRQAQLSRRHLRLGSQGAAVRVELGAVISKKMNR